jgi:hypothetical protein
MARGRCGGSSSTTPGTTLGRRCASGASCPTGSWPGCGPAWTGSTGAARDGPWTLATLRLIGGRPGVRAADLAAAMGRERQPFKADVRKLKELGLTESLEVGYRLSPRGRALLAASPDG